MSETDSSSIFHIGVLVDDLESSMAKLGDGFGLAWAKVVSRQQLVWTPGEGQQTTPLRFTYSRQGPNRIELLEGAPGSVWGAARSAGVHHIGVWTDDVAAEVARLVGLGWTLEAAQQRPEDGYGAMAYVRSPDGTLLEAVDARHKARFERWWAGGDFD